MPEQSKLDEQTQKMARIFYDFRDFRLRLDYGSPVHYDIGLDKLDPEGKKWVTTFRIYGTDRKGHLIIWERRWFHNFMQAPHREKMNEDFIRNYAEPLNAVPGRMEVK